MACEHEKKWENRMCERNNNFLKSLHISASQSAGIRGNLIWADSGNRQSPVLRISFITCSTRLSAFCQRSPSFWGVLTAASFTFTPLRLAGLNNPSSVNQSACLTHTDLQCTDRHARAGRTFSYSSTKKHICFSAWMNVLMYFNSIFIWRISSIFANTTDNKFQQFLLNYRGKMSFWQRLPILYETIQG